MRLVSAGSDVLAKGSTTSGVVAPERLAQLSPRLEVEMEVLPAAPRLLVPVLLTPSSSSALHPRGVLVPPTLFAIVVMVHTTGVAGHTIVTSCKLFLSCFILELMSAKTHSNQTKLKLVPRV